MTREEAKEVLDNLVLLHNSIHQMDGRYGVELCTSDYIHIYWGLEDLAEAMEMYVSCEMTKYSTMQKSFVYKDVTFIQINDITALSDGTVKVQDKHIKVEPKGIFKDMQKVVDDFDKATGNLHADLGTLGVVE